ncbi:MAG TPA: ANTAR domain-containing protein [Paenalcaligenes sp.]|nr:ANTAR domain-containing protein [Paenalcaligenes sp.]
MTIQPRIKSFSRRKATIISSSKECVERLHSTLMRMGVELRRVEDKPSALCFDEYELQASEDVIFLDGDLSEPLHLPAYPNTTLPLVPVIGMVGSEAPSRLGRLMTNGATTFIKKPIHIDTVFSTLFMAVNVHHERIALAQKIADLEDRRHGRRYVIKAVTLLMEHFAVDDDRAYDMLRRQSMHEQTTIESFARKVVEQQARSLDSLSA